MKKRKLFLLAAAGYFLLLLLLLLAEQSYGGSDSPGIRTFGDALWYSLVTLTTVGYGDLYPHSPLGKMIGTVFVLCSLGMLAGLISMSLSVLTGSMQPKIG